MKVHIQGQYIIILWEFWGKMNPLANDWSPIFDDWCNNSDDCSVCPLYINHNNCIAITLRSKFRLFQSDFYAYKKLK